MKVRNRRPRVRLGSTRRSRLERLEDRRVLANLTVDLVADLNPEVLSSNPAAFTELDGKVYFTADNPDYRGRSLHVYDPDTDVAGPLGYRVSGVGDDLAALDGLLYARYDDYSNGLEVAAFDPETGRPVAVLDVNTGSADASPQELTVMDGKLYYSAFTPATGRELFVYDPATGASELAAEVLSGSTYSNPKNLTPLDGKLYFSAYGGSYTGTELFSYDPATERASLVSDIYYNSYSSGPSDFAVLDGKLYFSAYHPTYGTELWSHDPATGRTALEADVGAGSSQPTSLTPLNGKLYFAAYYASGYVGFELVEYDPATGVTRLAADINSVGSYSSYPTELVAVGDTLYFNAHVRSQYLSGGRWYTQDYGRELIAYNSTSGNWSFHDIRSGSSSSEPADLFAFRGQLFFSAYEPSAGKELYKVDPSGQNRPELVADLAVASSSPRELVVAGDELYFAAYTSSYGDELYKHDPATGQTLRRFDIDTRYSTYPRYITELNGTLFFQGYHTSRYYYSYGTELVEFNPTTGYWRVYDLVYGGGPSYPNDLRVVDGILYFDAYWSGQGYKLTTFDPVTRRVTRLPDRGVSVTSPGPVTPLDGKLYFSGYADGYGRELFVYDPATGETSLAADLTPGGGYSSPSELTTLGGKLYFSGYADGYGAELFVYDPATGESALVADIDPGSSSSLPTDVTIFDGKLYFQARTSDGGYELSVYDPASGESALVADLVPGAASSFPSDFTIFDNKLYFRATTGATGAEIFYLDPDAGTVQLAADIVPGPGSSSPTELTVLGDKLYFQATTPTTGRELYVARLNTKPTVNSGNPDDGAADRFLVTRDADELVVTVNGMETLRRNLVDLEQLTLNGSGDDDAFTIDYTNGPIDLPILVHGEDQTTGDSFTLLGAEEGVELRPDGAEAGSGQITVGVGAIEFTGLEPLAFDFATPVPFTLETSGIDDTLAIGPMASTLLGQAAYQLSGDSDGVALGPIDLLGPAAVTFLTDGGEDVVVAAVDAQLPLQLVGSDSADLQLDVSGVATAVIIGPGRMWSPETATLTFSGFGGLSVTDGDPLEHALGDFYFRGSPDSDRLTVRPGVGDSFSVDLTTGRLRSIVGPFESVTGTFRAFALDGDDRIEAHSVDAPMLLDGGPGRDFLYSGGGNDLLIGGPGVNYLYAGDGDNVLSGGDDRDTLIGGSGRDIMHAGDGRDYLRGFAGNDILLGQDGDDLLDGAEGDDVLVGGEGRDRLFAGSGDDVLLAGADRDDLRGDEGRDLLVSGEADDFELAAYGTDDVASLDQLLADWVADPAGMTMAATDDGQPDRIFGGESEDAFAAGGRDRIYDREAGDRLL